MEVSCTNCQSIEKCSGRQIESAERGQGFIHYLCFYILVVDVTKGSPVFPACFFPFYVLRMYVDVRRIWLGDGRDVQLVSYQRDLGVWMFPGVRKVWSLLAIALKLNAVFVP